MKKGIEILALHLLGKTVRFERYRPLKELVEGTVVGFSGHGSLTVLCNKGWVLKESYWGTLLTDLPQGALLWHVSIDEIIEIV